jgi:pimeloyl-ACP methyl ester carboxylesterase
MHLTFNHHRIAYDLSGTGSALVFVHGFGEDRSVFQSFAHFFVDNYQVLNIDITGVGESEPLKEYSLEYMADCLHAVLQKEEIKNFILIGHSMGGYLALAFIEKYPDFVKGLCLFHSHPFEDAPEKKAGRIKSMEFVKNNGTAPFVKPLISNLFAHNFAKNNQAIIDYQIQKATQYPPHTIIGCLNAMTNRPDRTSVLKNATFPVLFIIGKEDSSISFSQSLQQTHLPSFAQIEILENVGHLGMLEAPEKSRAALQKFISLIN